MNTVDTNDLVGENDGSNRSFLSTDRMRIVTPWILSTILPTRRKKIGARTAKR